MAGIMEALKGIGGEFEVTRVVGAFGATAYVVCANGFVAYDVMRAGHAFDLTAYCLAFPAGLSAVVAAIAGAAAVKDRNVAVARQTQAAIDATTAQTGAG